MSHKWLLVIFVSFNICIVKSENIELCNNVSQHISCSDFVPSVEFDKCIKPIKNIDLTEEEQDEILLYINDLRNKIASGTFKPPKNEEIFPSSGSMTQVIWDNNLAKSAQKKLLYCNSDDLPEENRKFGNFVAKAFNPYLIKDQSIVDALDDLFTTDISHFNITELNNYTVNENYDVGTILLHDSTLFVGCAIGDPCFVSGCSRQGICYFAPSEIENGYNKLYTIGTPCSECPFIADGLNCTNLKFKNLCDRPPLNILDVEMQKTDIDKIFDPTQPDEDPTNGDGGFGDGLAAGLFPPDTDKSGSTTETNDNAGDGSGAEKNLANLFLISLYFCINILGKF